MSAALSALNLADDFEEARTTPDAARWKLEKPAALEVRVALSPARAAEESFLARLLWSAYPGEAPSLKFVDPATGRIDAPSAWPKVNGFRPASLDACVNWTQEGFALHPEWRTDPRYRWDPRGNVLLKVLRYLQSSLDQSFSGRHP
jgi:hypothetical protein